MTEELKKQMEESLSAVKSAFILRPLSEQIDKILEIQSSGAGIFFSGEVMWHVSLPEYDKLLKGHSESLNSAFSDMSRCLSSLLENHDKKTQVLCSVELSSGGLDE